MDKRNNLNNIDAFLEETEKIKNFNNVCSEFINKEKQDIYEDYENSENFYVSLKSIGQLLPKSYFEDESFLKLCLYQNKNDLISILHLFTRYGYNKETLLYILMKECDIEWMSGFAPKDNKEKINKLIEEQLRFIYDGVWLSEFKEYYEPLYIENISSMSDTDIYLTYEAKKIIDRLSLNNNVFVLNYKLIDSVCIVKCKIGKSLINIKFKFNDNKQLYFLLEDESGAIKYPFYDSKEINLIINKLFSDTKKDEIFSFDRVYSYIYRYNKDRNLLDVPFDLKKEATYILEEIIELFEIDGDPKELSRKIIEDYPLFKNTLTKDPEIIIDTFIDIMVFCFGALMKYIKSINSDYDEFKIRHLILKNFISVTLANLGKSKESDFFGKNIKGDSFIKPEIYTKVDNDEV